MNNDAFKDLVRSKVKSSKEIAREAVEEAFHHKKKKRKRKGRGNNDDDLSSSSESESESRSNNNKKQRDDHLLPTSVRNKREQKSGEDEGASHLQYRDRAKERREGKGNKDYEDSEKMMETVAQAEGETSLDQAEMSKYLGGDEAHTHLVKGLDVALARSVRNEMKPHPTGEDGGEEISELDMKSLPISTTEEAWEYIERSQLDSNTSRSALGRSMLAFLQDKRKRTSVNKQRLIQVSTAGSAIQRTQLSFSTDWNPRNLALSWEVPSEKSQAAAMATQGAQLPKACPLPSDLIQQIIGSQASSLRRTHVKVGNDSAGGGGDNGSARASEDESEDDIFPDAGG